MARRHRPGGCRRAGRGRDECGPIREVYAGALFWPIDAASEVLHTWRLWTSAVPEEITSVGRLLRLPPLPDLPDHLRGRSFAVVEAVCLSHDKRAAARLLAPLRVLHPEMNTFRPTPVLEVFFGRW